MTADEPSADEPSADEPSTETPLGERLLDALVYAPAGLALSVVEELPKLALRGRERFASEVSSARAVGELVVQGGRQQVGRRSGELFRRHVGGGGTDTPVTPRPPAGDSVPTGTGGDPEPGTEPGTVPAPGTAAAPDVHLPAVASLAIPGFDALSASQVVQRLDGMSRQELIAVRAYEAGTRGRRTVLSRVDQLLDERA